MKLSRRPPLIALLAASALSSGCYNLSGQVRAVTTERDSVVSERAEVTEGTLEVRFALRARVVEDALAIEVERIGLCREETVATIRTDASTVRELPNSHWIVFGSGLALLGGGAAMLGVGLDGLATGADLEIGTAEEERAYDEGMILTGVGAGALGLGLSMTISEIADMVMATDTVEPSVERETRSAGGLVECLHEGAASASVEILANGGRAYVLTGDQGTKSLPLETEPLRSLTDGRAATVRLSCEGCDPVVLELPAVNP